MASEKEFSVKVWHVVVLSIIVGALVTVAMFLLVREKNMYKQAAEWRLEDIRRYEIIVDSLKHQVAEARLRIVTKENELILSAEQIAILQQEKIRNVLAIGDLRLQVSALKTQLEVKVPPDTVVREVQIIDDTPMIELPAYFDFNDDWLSMWGNIDETGSGALGMTLQGAPVDIVLGSRGLMRKEFVSSISTPNPYVEFDMNNVQLVMPKKTKPILIGTGLGVLTGAIATFFIMR